MSTSKGALATANAFLIRNNFVDKVISASNPKANVMVDSLETSQCDYYSQRLVSHIKPMMVRNCRCHPYESLIGFGVMARLSIRVSLCCPRCSYCRTILAKAQSKANCVLSVHGYIDCTNKIGMIVFVLTKTTGMQQCRKPSGGRAQSL